MLNITQIVYEKPLSTPINKGYITNKKKKKNESRKEIRKVFKRSPGMDG